MTYITPLKVNQDPSEFSDLKMSTPPLPHPHPFPVPTPSLTLSQGSDRVIEAKHINCTDEYGSNDYCEHEDHHIHMVSVNRSLAIADYNTSTNSTGKHHCSQVSPVTT